MLVTIENDERSMIDSLIKDLDMEDFINEKAVKYSLGMKQKLGIAMAMVNNPNLVILDEPMNGLDPTAIKVLRELILKKKNEGITFFISSHILGELQKISDDLIIINHGKILVSTTMNKFLETNSKQYICLTTNNDEIAKKTLIENNIRILNTNEICIPNDEVTLDQVVELLKKIT